MDEPDGCTGVLGRHASPPRDDAGAPGEDDAAAVAAPTPAVAGTPLGTGSGAEFEVVFRSHYADLVRGLSLAAGDRELAADCVADAFERAYVRWWRIRRYDDPVAWIRRVAVNRLRDHQRRARRRDRALERLAGRRDDRVPADPVDAGARIRPGGLDDALARLPPRQRTAISLHYVGGLPVAEVADAMSLTPGAVKYHLHAGRERLRPLVDPQEDR